MLLLGRFEPLYQHISGHSLGGDTCSMQHNGTPRISCFFSLFFLLGLEGGIQIPHTSSGMRQQNRKTISADLIQVFMGYVFWFL